jgi:hypothetical protein
MVMLDGHQERVMGCKHDWRPLKEDAICACTPSTEKETDR